MNDSNLKKNQHSVYALYYHVVLVVKKRRPVLTDEMCVFLRVIGKRLLEGWGGELVELNTDRDHLHMLIGLKPSQAPSVYISVLKTQFSKQLHKHFGPEIQLQLKDDAFWTRSYYVATTGGVNLEAVKSYIEEQQTEKHKRKYEKTGKYAGYYKKHYKNRNRPG